MLNENAHSEKDARAAIESWLDEHAPGYPTYELARSGDSWAFWVADHDKTSYLNKDLSVEWYGTLWPDSVEYDGDTGIWLGKVKSGDATMKDCEEMRLNRRIAELEVTLGQRVKAADAMREVIVAKCGEVTSLEKQVAELGQQLAAKQAKIDALMFEYCPDEMTQEQIAEWGMNQRAAGGEV
jgi:uncharacterized coiled-coil protein SlyX